MGNNSCLFCEFKLIILGHKVLQEPIAFVLSFFKVIFREYKRSLSSHETGVGGFLCSGQD